MNKITDNKELLREISLVIGGEYASYKLSEEAWNYWLEIVKLIKVKNQFHLLIISTNYYDFLFY